MSTRATWLLCLALAGGCAVDQPAITTGCPPLKAPAGRIAYPVATDASEVRIYVYRSGPLAALGHNHVVAARQVTGWLALRREGDLAGGQAELCVPLAALRVDEPALRATAGAGFASQPDAAAVAGTTRNMLGAEVLDAAQYPDARLALRAVGVAGETVALRARITLHGVTRELPVTARLHPLPGGWEARGSFMLRQSDFGITPFSALGGALQVQDEVRVDYRVVARRPAAQAAGLPAQAAAEAGVPSSMGISGSRDHSFQEPK